MPDSWLVFLASFVASSYSPRVRDTGFRAARRWTFPPSAPSAIESGRMRSAAAEFASRVRNAVSVETVLETPVRLSCARARYSSPGAAYPISGIASLLLCRHRAIRTMPRRKPPASPS